MADITSTTSRHEPELLLERLLAIREEQHGALTDASVLHYPGISGLAGPYQGRSSVIGLLLRLDDLSESTFSFLPQRCISDDDRTLIRIGRSRGGRGPVRLDAETVQVVSRHEAQIKEIWLFYPDQACFDAFWMS